jgi:alanine dehydrogenase
MTVQEKSNENSLISKAMLLPQEEMLEVKKRGQKIKIGIPSDFSKVEYRVPLTPQAIDLLVSYGHEILIETNAGKSASYSDKAYRDVGHKLSIPKRKSSSAILFCVFRLSATMK